MSVSEIILNVIISILGGFVSGLVVNKAWDKRMKKTALNIQYKNEIQIVSRYLSSLQTELQLLHPSATAGSEELIRKIESRPATTSFEDKMNENGRALMGEIAKVCYKLQRDAERGLLDEKTCNSYYYKLFELQVSILKNQSLYKNDTEGRRAIHWFKKVQTWWEKLPNDSKGNISSGADSKLSHGEGTGAD